MKLDANGYNDDRPHARRADDNGRPSFADVRLKEGAIPVASQMSLPTACNLPAANV